MNNDYPREAQSIGANKSDISLTASISEIHNLIAEIKSIVIEPIPKNETAGNTPRSEHKLSNINQELMIAKRNLQEILQAVSYI